MLDKSGRAGKETGHGVWAQVALMAIVGVGSMVMLEARPADPHEAAGVFPPWWSRRAVVVAASQAGRIVSAGRAPFIIIVRAPQGDVAARLAKSGALFSIDPAAALGCGHRV
jgi:hypothetical protein